MNDEYSVKRQSVCDANGFAAKVILNKNEKMLDARLKELKAEFLAGYPGRFPGSIFTLADDALISCRLYDFCKRLPKMCDLHVHGCAFLPVPELIAFLMTRNDVFIKLNAPKKGMLYPVSSGENIPEDVCLFRDAINNGLITEAELSRLWSVLGDDGRMDIWDFLETFFDKDMVLSATSDILEAYYKEAFAYYCRLGIYHVQIRTLVFGSNEDAAANVSSVRSAYYAVKKDFPQLIVKMVVSGLKAKVLDMSLTEMLLDNACYTHENVKDEFDPQHVSDFVIGFDLVNEEDKSKPIHEFSDLIAKVRRRCPNLKLYLHAGESLAFDNTNVFDAYLLSADRVGHGFNLYKFPDLLNKFIEKDICLEVCPISNRTLHYIEDLRLHPGLEYMKRGLPVVLASDDPSYQARTPLVDDFFAAILCWDLGVGEIKQLILNSINYSKLTAFEIDLLKNTFEKEWDRFVESMI